MSDDYQIDIAQSFVILFLEPGRSKPGAPRAHIAQRYELCEDMAQMLVPTAQELLHKFGGAELDVLQRVFVGLTGDGAVVTRLEAVWVMRRLAELCSWAQLGEGWPEEAAILT